MPLRFRRCRKGSLSYALSAITLLGLVFGLPAPLRGTRMVSKVSFCKRYFRWRGRFKDASQRNTLAIDHHHPLRSLTPLGLTDSCTPFFAGTKLPSMNVSSQSRSPRWSSCERKARHISTQTPSSSHFFSRRQQVAGLGYLSGRSLHFAPVRATHKMPSNTKRSSTLRRPPFGLRVSGGNKGLILLHCSSVNSCVRFLIGLPPTHVPRPESRRVEVFFLEDSRYEYLPVMYQLGFIVYLV